MSTYGGHILFWVSWELFVWSQSFCLDGRTLREWQHILYKEKSSHWQDEQWLCQSLLDHLFCVHVYTCPRIHFQIVCVRSKFWILMLVFNKTSTCWRTFIDTVESLNMHALTKIGIGKYHSWICTCSCWNWSLEFREMHRYYSAPQNWQLRIDCAKQNEMCRGSLQSLNDRLKMMLCMKFWVNLGIYLIS